jgi:hypothetical protein
MLRKLQLTEKYEERERQNVPVQYQFSTLQMPQMTVKSAFKSFTHSPSALNNQKSQTSSSQSRFKIVKIVFQVFPTKPKKPPKNFPSLGWLQWKKFSLDFSHRFKLRFSLFPSTFFLSGK